MGIMHGHIGAMKKKNRAPTGSISISGSTTVGSSLSVSLNTLNDPNGVLTYTYQWLRNGSPISNQSSTSYTTVSGDASNNISIRCTFTDRLGNVNTSTSNSITPIVVSTNTKFLATFQNSIDTISGNSWSLGGSSTISGGMITLPNNGTARCSFAAASNLNTSDYTLEFWYLLNSIGSTGDHNDVSIVIGNIQTGVGSDGKLYYDDLSNGSTGWGWKSGTAIPLNSWTHMAIVRRSNTMYMYINGSLSSTSTHTALVGSASRTISNITLGNRSGTSHDQFSIHDIRLVISAVYTGNFSVPSYPLGQIS